MYNHLPLMRPHIQLKLFGSYFHEPYPSLIPLPSVGTHLVRWPSTKVHRFKDVLVEHKCLVYNMGKFLKACRDTDIALVDHMFHSQRQPLQEKDSFKNNCRYCALVSNNLELFTLLKGASISVGDRRHRTRVHVACENGHEDIVKILLDREVNLDVQRYYTGADLCFLITGKDKGESCLVLSTVLTASYL